MARNALTGDIFFLLLLERRDSLEVLFANQFVVKKARSGERFPCLVRFDVHLLVLFVGLVVVSQPEHVPWYVAPAAMSQGPPCYVMSAPLCKNFSKYSLASPWSKVNSSQILVQWLCCMTGDRKGNTLQNRNIIYQLYFLSCNRKRLLSWSVLLLRAASFVSNFTSTQEYMTPSHFCVL